MRDEIKSNNHDRRVVLEAMERRLETLEHKVDTRFETLEEKVDNIDRRIRPRWWDYIIIAGAGIMALVLLLQLILVAAH
jgi:hypothetical protein